MFVGADARAGPTSYAAERRTDEEMVTVDYVPGVL
jgi:hypothetical protein